MLKKTCCLTMAKLDYLETPLNKRASDECVKFYLNGCEKEKLENKVEKNKIKAKLIKRQMLLQFYFQHRFLHSYQRIHHSSHLIAIYFLDDLLV